MSTAPFTVLTIAGSLRRGSHTRSVLDALAADAPEGVTFVPYEGLADVPPYNGDLDTPDPPPAVADLRRRIGDADAVLIGTPEFNATIPGVLKNALDWASRPFGVGATAHKPFAVFGVSPSRFGAVWAAADLRRSLTTAGGRVLDAELGVGKVDAHRDAAGTFTDDETLDRLRELVHGLRGLAAAPVAA